MSESIVLTDAETGTEFYVDRKQGAETGGEILSLRIEARHGKGATLAGAIAELNMLGARLARAAPVALYGESK